MQEQTIIETQLEFYRNGGAGCLFAAHAARDPSKYGWRFSISNVDTVQIEELIQSAISLADVSTQSIIFPSVMMQEDLKTLLLILKETPSVSLEQEEEFEDAVCLGYRISIGDLKSWVTGFGGFDFFPKTRQAVFTEIVFRTKPRPDYEWVMKETPHGIIHLADMDMKGMRENQFKALWYGFFDNTENILGHKPDLRSAAKTTFAVPLELWRGV
ncbi:MAG: hypothetical protein CO183_00085 [Candidatus Zambryskibacteria bacterium CG_4_9_14_3_um_filter_42_9]|uniref:Uncharacterized protein n=1 Tax=Candidatus Zambryskibacteria bacterium CG22_combo_CG10-13_8_21_14_all_42_17 TaxID=1975118 RepID=A0A2H0BDU2_9BACT|nr:MAG: hypothetical protein COX06_01045 [Candidatus Zambryskibacteria bacterium CG22_combo_CG10-13_8_21_14_all_42_17]PJA37080.1 MAG: hypothetical protein CO183_00085 [Candidatus Zambryskibacteria bacterium CG_4_9_14_3_um_filter_42_9]